MAAKAKLRAAKGPTTQTCGECMHRVAYVIAMNIQTRMIYSMLKNTLLLGNYNMRHLTDHILHSWVIKFRPGSYFVIFYSMT